MSDKLKLRAHAKVNLFLRVFAKEALSGYHVIETAFALLELHDELTVAKTGRGIELEVHGGDVGPAEENLAYRAARAVLEATGSKFGVTIDLQKNIPVGAGLGGGSADAATTLIAVNRLAGNPIPRHELIQMAAKLGADVPFLTSGLPMAVGWNRGERLYRIDPPKPAPVLLVCPAVSVATGAAYGLLGRDRAEQQRGSIILERDAFRGWGSIGRLGGNDFEGPVFGKHPEIRELFERLAETRPLMVRMTGSGSALFAVYKNDRERDDAKMSFGSQVDLIATTTRSQPPEPPN